MNDVRVRIAPSPSGFLHIGTAKIALINWLYARKTGGAFILRLEDTDAERSDEAYAQAMLDGFKWLGIEWDEGPAFGDQPEKGDYGPYRQSQRLPAHRDAAMRLVDKGRAYRCFCTKDELDVERAKAREEKRSPHYSGKCRDLTEAEIAGKGDAPYAVRFRVPGGTTVIEDLVQGTVRVENAEFDDFIILRPGGYPVFHLAVVVDDGDMKISHVIRGDDHLTNTARHAMLFEALGYETPYFAHLPMVLDEAGRKYSKREHGANVLDWRDDGYLPEAILNYVVLLGWSEGDDRELYTRDELISAFTIERLAKSAGKFNLKKVQWLNGQHLRLLPVEELQTRLVAVLRDAGLDLSSKTPEWLAQMTAICQEKLSTLNDIVGLTDFFFREPQDYEEKAVKKRWKKEGALERMETIAAALAQCDPWDHDGLKACLETLAESAEVGLGQFIHPTRLALTGKSVGPGFFELAELLGKETCVARIDRAIAHIKTLG